MEESVGNGTCPHAWLQELFAQAELQSHLLQASAWVQESGCTLSDLASDEEALVDVQEHLGLRKYEIKRLRRAIHGGPDTPGTSPPSSLSSPNVPPVPSGDGSGATGLVEHAPRGLAELGTVGEEGAFSERRSSLKTSRGAATSSSPPRTLVSPFRKQISFDVGALSFQNALNIEAGLDSGALDPAFSSLPSIMSTDTADATATVRQALTKLAQESPDSFDSPDSWDQAQIPNGLTCKNTFFDIPGSPSVSTEMRPAPATCPLPTQDFWSTQPPSLNRAGSLGRRTSDTHASAVGSRRTSAALSEAASRRGSDVSSTFNEIGPTPDWYGASSHDWGFGQQGAKSSASHFEGLLAQATSASRRSSDASRRGSDVAQTFNALDEVGASLATPDCFGPTPDLRHQTPGQGFASQASGQRHFARLLDQAAAEDEKSEAASVAYHNEMLRVHQLSCLTAASAGGCGMHPFIPPMPMGFMPPMICMEQGLGTPLLGTSIIGQDGRPVVLDLALALTGQSATNASPVVAAKPRPRRRGTKKPKDPDIADDDEFGGMHTAVSIDLGSLVRVAVDNATLDPVLELEAEADVLFDDVDAEALRRSSTGCEAMRLCGSV